MRERSRRAGRGVGCSWRDRCRASRWCRRGGGVVVVALVLVLAAGLRSPVFAQVRGEVVGFVRDGEGRAVVRAGVELPSLGLSTWTDGEGRFVLRSVPSGRHPLRVVSVGYAPERLDVEVPAGGGAVFVEVSLRATPLVLPGLSVTAVPGRG